MNKKLFLLLLSLLPLLAQGQTWINGIWYNLNSSTKTAEVTSKPSYGHYSGTVNIPQTVANEGITYSVTSIGNYAFYECYGLTSVTIPNSVTSIGSGAFDNCSGLTSVTIPNSVTSIAGYAFEGCSGLTSVTIGNRVASIGKNAFEGCSGLTSVHISDLSAWYNISFGSDSSNPLYYAHHLYLNGTEVTDLVIPDGVTSISNYAFEGCSSLTSVTIPNSVTKIGNGAFYGCSGLTSVTIPKSVTSIGSSAFYGCSSLTSVTIPNGVTSIGNSAFFNCSGLRSVHISDLAAWCNISFSGYNSNPLYYAHHLYLNGTEVTDLVIPNSVTSIGEYAFIKCSGLTSVTIPNSVTSIGSSAFYNCSGLTSVTIPNSVTSIGNYAFSGCKGLTSVTIPYGVTSIGQSTFYQCSGLTSVTIPNSVTSIGNKAFSGCSGLQEVVCLAKSFPTTSSDAFYNVSLSNVKLFVWSKLLERYRNNSPWSGFGTISAVDVQRDGFYYVFDTPKEEATITDADNTSGNLNIPSYVVYEGVDYDVVAVHEYAFLNCSDMTSVNIPNSVTTIGDGAFEGCSGLTSLSIGKKTKSIGQNAFKGCSGLNSITVASGNTVYDSRNNCNAIIETASEKLIQGCNSTVIPDDVTSIGDAAFYNCSGLTSVNIPNSVTSIGDYAFNNCRGLTSVTIPNSVTSIGNSAFSGCTGLTSVTFHCESIDSWFARFSSIQEIVIGDEVTKINNDAFNGCTGLTSVTIGNSVTSIGASAFYNCRITSITIPASVTAIGENAFYGCNWLNSTTIPASVTAIGENAFYGCSMLNSTTISDLEAWCNISFGNQYSNPLYQTHHLNLNGTEVKDLAIPTSVNAIGNYAFYGCSGLTSVNIPNSVTSIGISAFSGCSGLTSVTINSNAIVSANRTQKNNINSIFGNQVKEYIIGNRVTSIGESAFSGNTNLTTVSVGKNIGSIGDNAFYGCSNLATFTCYAADIPTANSSVFEGIDLTTATLYVPASALEEYEETKPWKRFGTILLIDEEAVPTAIDTAAEDDYKEYFDLSGHRVTSSQRGLLIVRDRSGKTRKAMVK